MVQVKCLDCCPFYGNGSVGVDLLFIVALNVVVMHLFLVLLCSTLCLF